MARILFRRASSGFRLVRGELIKKVQKTLKSENIYDDFLDGIYGGNTERALITYQQRNGLNVSGKIDEATWQKLIGQSLPPIRERSLQLTADFEGTGFTKVVGNFDGAGLTWGIIGFTLSNGELGKLLKEINQQHPNLFQQAFTSLADDLLQILNKSLSEQKIWANSISIGSDKYKVKEPWRSGFETLGSFAEVQAIQIDHTQHYWDIALRDAQKFNLRTELGLALSFDIAVQNGGIDSHEAAEIQAKINQSSPTTEQDIRKIISNVVAEHSNRRWVEDVRKRKLAIATAQGTVHGANYEIKPWGLDEVPV